MGLLAESQYSTGALNQPVKTEPLPVGVYWIDVYDTETNNANIATFHNWTELHKDTVQILRTEMHDTSRPWWEEFPWAGVLSEVLKSKYPIGIWALFEVKQPTRWDQSESLGWPNEATPDMTASDTIQKPDPPKGPFDDGYEWPSWTPWAISGGVVVIGLGVLIALRR